MRDEKRISVGSWVRIGRIWPGVWQVSRLLSGFNELQWTLNAAPIQSPRTLAFCDRIVNNDWKRSFKTQGCEASYLELLNPDEANKLESQLSADTRLSEAFAKYQTAPHPIDLVANIALGGMSDETVTQFPSICDEMLRQRIESGLTVNEVLQSIFERDLPKYCSVYPVQVTLQVTCVDHETRSNEFVFRKYRILKG